MNTDAIKRLLTILSSAIEVERGQLYQLVQSAESSYYFRDIHSQREIGLLLQSFGYPFNQVGKFYESIYLHRTGQYEKARKLLECVAESAPARYRSKALFSLSAVEARIGHFEESLRLRLQVASSTDDPLISLEAQQSVAVHRSMEGSHKAALRDLERLFPLAHIIGKHGGHPAYITFLNSYAWELSEVGRTEEAEQVSEVIAHSPLIGRYREWQETLAEIAKNKSRSRVYVSTPAPKELPENVLLFPGAKLPDTEQVVAEIVDRLSEFSFTPLQLLGFILRIVLKERITSPEIDLITTVYYDTIKKWFP